MNKTRLAVTLVSTIALAASALGFSASTADATTARCTATNSPSGYKGWDKTNCHTWHSSTGMHHGGKLYTGKEWVVCQVQASANPAYGGHHNTWWVWTLGDTGGWDYFPATAFVEGGENVAIGGIPKCF